MAFYVSHPKAFVLPNSPFRLLHSTTSLITLIIILSLCYSAFYVSQREALVLPNSPMRLFQSRTSGTRLVRNI